MLLPFQGTQDRLLRTTHYDRECARLADRHYSRRTPGARQFCYAGRKIVMRDTAGLVVFVWMFPRPELRMDGQRGYYCSLLRNESSRLSSEIILEAEEWAFRTWGPHRLYTFVNPRKIRSTNPGYCFLCAGWERSGMTKGGLVILAKYNHLAKIPR